MVLSALGKPQWVPATDAELVDWCNSCTANDLANKDVRAIVILGTWELWKHRNTVVFDGASPSDMVVLSRIVSECKAWKLAGVLKGDFSTFLGLRATWVGGSS